MRIAIQIIYMKSMTLSNVGGDWMAALAAVAATAASFDKVLPRVLLPYCPHDVDAMARRMLCVLFQSKRCVWVPVGSGF